MTDTKENDIEHDEGVVIDLRTLYAFKPEDLAIEISSTFYSNIAYMQVAPREVIIDFLKMPGMKKDGKVIVDGIRVYMSHVAALKMIESLGALLEKNVDKIEKLELPHSKDVELTTEIRRPSENEQA